MSNLRTFTVREHLDGSGYGLLLLASAFADIATKRAELWHNNMAYIVYVQYEGGHEYLQCEWDLQSTQWILYPDFFDFPVSWSMMRKREKHLSINLSNALKCELGIAELAVSMAHPAFDTNGALVRRGVIFITVPLQPTEEDTDTELDVQPKQE